MTRNKHAFSPELINFIKQTEQKQKYRLKLKNNYENKKGLLLTTSNFILNISTIDGVIKKHSQNTKNCLI